MLDGSDTDETEMFQNAAVSVYTSNVADIQSKTRGTSTLAAGYNSSLQGVIPIVLTPAVGWFFDHYGWRMAFVSWTGALYIVVFALLGFTTVHPLCPILLSSFALSTNAISFIASIPVLVGDDALLGTAMGVWKAFVSAPSYLHAMFCR
jgi:MFS-type transporter involved in bile tolerance (Atg22 family)